MAITSGNDISVVLSGGANNLDPNKSLGGDPSSAPLRSGILNTLFPDVSADEASNGSTTYRCIYIFNDGSTAIYNVNMFILTPSTATTIAIGMNDANEFQRILIINAGSVTGGSINVSYEGHGADFPYDTDLAGWCLAIQNFLNSLVDTEQQPILSNVTVTGQLAGSSIIFDIHFTGNDGHRNHPPLVVVNNLTPSGSTSSVITLQDGSPVNSISADIGVETTPPAGVIFSQADQFTPLVLPRVEPSEGYALWIQRTVAPNTVALADDNVVLRIHAESLAV